MNGARRRAGAAPCALALSAAPRKNFDSDKVPSGNHTHASQGVTY